MSTPKHPRNRSGPRFPRLLSRDRARPRATPAPSSPAVEERLTELVAPATYRLVDHYHHLGLRERLLTLPIMVAMVLSMIWRQVPSTAELVRTVAREGLLWTPPVRASEQAFNMRLRSLPPELFEEVHRAVLPVLLARARERSRPVAPALERALGRFEHIWIVDGTTLEEVSRRVGLLREETRAVMAGHLLAVLDLPSKLPVELILDANPKANDKAFLDRLKPLLLPGTLLVLDRGFYSFPLFDHLTEHSVSFVSRARSLASFQVERVMVNGPQVRDRIVRLGSYRSNPCRHPVRLVEVFVDGAWRAYLTNVLDPLLLSAADVVDLYSRRWRIEDAFLTVKRLLGLAYVWKGAFNTVALQVWATFLLYAVLIDLSDAVAQELSLPLDQTSVEMVYRGLYHFTVAHSKGQAADPVAYLASQPDLGIVKRRRKYRERQPLDSS